MKKILMICYAFPPMGVVGSLRPLRFCKYLQRFGWEPTVVTTKNRDDLPTDRSLLKELPCNIRIHRVINLKPLLSYLSHRKNVKTLSPTEKSGNIFDTINLRKKIPKRIKKLLLLFLRVPRHIIWSICATLRSVPLLLRREYDAIFTTCPPYSGHIAGLVLSKLFKKPWIADFRELWVDHPFFNVSRSIFRIQLESWIEKRVICNATLITCITEYYVKLLSNKYPEKTFYFLSNGYEKDEFDRISPVSFEKFTITHIGTFYSAMNPFTFFHGLKRWIESEKEKGNDKRRTNVQVILAGHENPEVRKTVQECQLQDVVRFMGYVPHDEAIRIAKSSDLLLLVMGLNADSPGRIPLKLIEYMGCKKPILGILLEGEAAEIIRKAKVGHVITSDDQIAVAKVLERAYRNKCANKEDSDFKPDLCFIKQFEQKNLTRRLVNILEELQKNKP